ncbi:MAG: hypothetical protein M3256_02015 [Actinomycetota bacterium]|nr:hypothetical protein [Actinomycetota bacterium]MDQ6945054.1 hypothetical protein [Actinomycetota bacterium]
MAEVTVVGYLGDPVNQLVGQRPNEVIVCVRESATGGPVFLATGSVGVVALTSTFTPPLGLGVRGVRQLGLSSFVLELGQFVPEGTGPGVFPAGLYLLEVNIFASDPISQPIGGGLATTLIDDFLVQVPTPPPVDGFEL